MKYNIITFFALLFCSGVAFGQKVITLENNLVKYDVVYNNDSLYLSNFNLKSDTLNYVKSKSKGFSFVLNDTEYSGFSKWNLDKVKRVKTDKTTQRVILTLKPKGEKTFKIFVNYEMYDNHPFIRKWITFENTGKEDFKIESLNVQDIYTSMNNTWAMVLNNYGRMKHLMKYEGDWDDPVVVIEQANSKQGMALGNEAMGILKRTAFQSEGMHDNVQVGLTHPNQDFPFRKWFKPKQSWTSPKTFIGLYHGYRDGFQMINNEVNKFVKTALKPRIYDLKEKPTFVYNTWYPFRTHISDTLIRRVAKAAAECGVKEFIIDDGWQVNAHGKSSIRGWGENYGDWHVDQNKFPGGLKPTFDYIKSLGMKPGLWISIGSATKDSKVYQEHPEWFVQKPDGSTGNLHFQSPVDNGFYSASFGTGWKDYMKETILRLVKDYGLAYAKMDLAVVTSPYVNDTKQSGSYAKDHPDYRDHNESFTVLYENMLKMFDELHEEAPELFIDCTYETTGKVHLMDYATAEHAEGNWLSNIEDPAPVGPMRVRQLAWWRSPAVPASSLVIGNLPMDTDDIDLTMKSLIGTLPIVLGDPDKLPVEKRQEMRSWADWMDQMQERFDYMSYRKDLEGFGEPREGYWDGWQRINYDTQEGGILGVFRQGAKESARMVYPSELNENATYEINLAPSGKHVITATGKELMERGFQVVINKKYGGELFEVSKVIIP
ncbi:glycoside hydrolase family 36 protein [Persicobacter psychrovividus]|uniref:Alpha-galactosidase n=1 Tax=Persicobacter psychrovividus TaxID=387638 RepID=A0ABM7VLQ9_9BACT|nr:hypothetical protein PEPS_42140 [Persicobacter psychrovividus]